MTHDHTHSDDTLALAERTKRAYGQHYVGAGKPRVLRDLISRYADAEDEELGERLTEFMRTKGPFLQALDLPRHGDSWREFASEVETATGAGLDEEVIRTFEQAGFEHLFEFQQDAIRRVLDDDHTLVTAGTGRGKTEAWLIPILQFICEAKEGIHPNHPAQSVKCLLTYPTKALAQDQLKRLIEYLYTLNETRTGTDRISVGIFDGDTPSNDPEAYEYLTTAFRFFECPCGECDASLTVKRTDDGYRVTHDAPGDPNLGFIQVTREEVVENEVDIVLTNPDTINHRLFNINEDEEQPVFIAQPKYVVFDEIHEYAELFGSFTSMLMRRYLRVRSELRNFDAEEDDDLRLVGASATVKNKEAVFNRLNPFVDHEVAVVEEDPRTLPTPEVLDIPPVFTNHELDEDALVAALADDVPPDAPTRAVFDAIELVPGEAETRRKARHRLENRFYAHFVEGEVDDLAFVRECYRLLDDTPMEPDTLAEELSSRTGLDDEKARTIVRNFIVLGNVSGVLESRAHLFSWPIDGYYTCLNCTSVYERPQSACRECDHHFVTKLAYCTHCGEEALESWFCPECSRVSPLTVTTSEGRFDYFESQECLCGTQMIQTIWRPFYECSGCGARQKLDHVHICEACEADAPMTLSADASTFICTNPECSTETDADTSPSCRSCHSTELELLSDDSVLFCADCGETHDAEEGPRCGCGGQLTPKRFIGWQCSDRSCSAVYFGTPPRTCECNNRRFVRTALFDINRVDHCSECDMSLIPGGACGCDSPSISPTIRGYSQYKTFDEQDRIRNPTDFPGAVPCYDRGQSYDKSRRYESMLRGPGNVAVTTAQYFLRSVADPTEPESFRRAKMLSFADSQANMKELTRNFNEPEEQLFVTQLFVETLEEADDEWVPLTAVETEVWRRAQEYQETLHLQIDTTSENLLKSLTPHGTSVQAYVADEVERRVLRGRFNNRRKSFLRLPPAGIVNVRLDVDTADLPPSEREVLGAFYSQSKRYVGSLAEEVDNAGRHVDSLIDRGILQKEDSESGFLVGLNPDAVEVALVSPSTSIAYDPRGERFYSEFDLTCRDVDADLVAFTDEYASRAAFDHPHFSLDAYRLAQSDPMLLLGRSYFGQTEKEQRRKLEYQFREGRHPHFLSSGPAMEVGVDIGDLDALLLYGTPPNTNSYLQRIGRAGRESGSSLVHSVSQRNPIDYYYFERPEELIGAKTQPVPLNEVNEAVLIQSLTWALLDFVAATTWVPWRREESALHDALYYDDDTGPIGRDQPKPNNVVSFSTLLASDCVQLQPGAPVSPLEGLRDAVLDNRTGAREWLEDLLAFSYCESCGYKHAAGYSGPCQAEECAGTAVSALAEFGDLVPDVFDRFEAELVDRFIEFEDELLDELDEIEDRISELGGSSRRRRRRGRDEDDLQEEEELNRLRERRMQLDGFLERLDELDYREFLGNYSDAGFSLRSVADTVSYELVGEGFEQVTDEPRTRNVQYAISDLHPGAAYLHDDNVYVVTELVEDSYETQQLRDRIPDAAICPNCAREHEIDVATCESCGHSLQRLVTVVPRRVRAHKADLPLGTLPTGETLTPSRIYRSGDDTIQRTYAPVENEATEFDPHPDRTFVIVDDNGNPQGTFAHGTVTIGSSATHFRASYENGGSDPRPTVFERCGVENCGGVITRDVNGAYCMRHPEHPTDDTDAVRLASEIETQTVRVQFDDEKLEHAFVHGLRVALQYIGGVGVRQVPESIEDDGTYVYDSEEGGSGITVLLTPEDGDDEKFQRALSIMADTFECDCESGCPFCLYQYGCTNRNDPESFEKERLLELIENGLHLEAIDPDEVV